MSIIGFAMPSVDREPPRVGDWWMCPQCGQAGKARPPHPHYPCCPDHTNVDAVPLTLTEADWLKCRSPQALIAMFAALRRDGKVTWPEVPGEAATEQSCRCLFGNPFRPFTLDPSWLTWNDGAVRGLAEGCFVRSDESQWHILQAWRLTFLADALEEAGCDRDDVLRHLREPQAHWPGCFVLRAILTPPLPS